MTIASQTFRIRNLSKDEDLIDRIVDRKESINY